MLIQKPIFQTEKEDHKNPDPWNILRAELRLNHVVAFPNDSKPNIEGRITHRMINIALIPVSHTRILAYRCKQST